ncbi:hydroxysqualene dehydroxylase HpnE [Jatrophihabitans sp. YIM 134969]
MNVVVVGGGLAGVTAALRLADAGERVTLLEAKPRLGGAAFSFARGDLTIDNGQHVFLRCCTAYRGFLERVDATSSTSLQRRLDIPVIAGADQHVVAPGTSARLRRSGLPVPAHLAKALLTYRVLPPLARLRAIRGATALQRLDPADPALDTDTLGGYLRRHGQDDATLAALFDVVGTATLNLRADDASLALAATVFRTGLLDQPEAADIGHATVPLGHLHDDLAAAALARAGVEVRRTVKVREVAPDGRVTVAARGGADETLQPDAVVLAVPHTTAAQLAGSVPPATAGLGASPIVNVHVVYDRPVTGHAFAAGVGSAVQWVFDRTASSGLAARTPGAQYLAVTVSAADREIDEPVETLRPRFLDALATLFPRARTAHVLEFFVTRERRATFRQAAGTAPLRPGPRVPGTSAVVLAGAWTATGWPDTMESAVRSGHAAAATLLGDDPGSRFDDRASAGSSPPGGRLSRIRSSEGMPA